MLNYIDQRRTEEINVDNSSTSGKAGRKSKGTDDIKVSAKAVDNLKSKRRQAPPFDNKYGVDLRYCKLEFEFYFLLNI